MQVINSSFPIGPLQNSTDKKHIKFLNCTLRERRKRKIKQFRLGIAVQAQFRQDNAVAGRKIHEIH